MSRVVELLCSRRVPQIAVLTLMSFGFAGCSADMPTRLSQNTLSNPSTISRKRPVRCSRRRRPGRAPRAAAIFAAANPAVSVAIPVVGLAATAAGRRAPRSYPAAAIRRVGRRPRAFVLYAAEPTPSLRPPPPLRRVRSPLAPAHGGTTIIVGTSDTLDILAQALQRFVRRDPAGQWLQGTARAVARPATDHSAPDRCRCARAGSGAAGQQAGRGRGWRRRASTSSIAATR